MHQISMQIQSLSNQNLAGIFPKRPKSASATDEKRSKKTNSKNLSTFLTLWLMEI